MSQLVQLLFIGEKLRGKVEVISILSFISFWFVGNYSLFDVIGVQDESRDCP